MKNVVQNPSPALVQMLQNALSLQKAGKMAEAEVLYRQALKENPENPENPDVLHIAAIFFDQAGNDRYALSLLKKLASKKAGDFAFNTLYGKSLYKNENFEEAEKILRKALLLNTEDADANYYMGVCLYKMKRLKEAEQFFRRSLQKKDSINAKEKLGEILLDQERHAEIISLLEVDVKRGACTYQSMLILAAAYGFFSAGGMQILINAIRVSPERNEAKAIFAQTVGEGYVPNIVDKKFQDVVIACLETRNVNHVNLQSFWQRQFFNPENPKAEKLLAVNHYEEFKKLYESGGCKESVLVPFFVEGVKKILVCSVSVENLLTHLRRFYLDKICQGQDLSKVESDLITALSCQAFFNEFVFNVSEDEKEKLKALDLHNDDHLMIYSCYQPLSNIGGYEDLLKKKKGRSSAIMEIIEVQLESPALENKIKKTIQSLGSIKGQTSRQVQNQYEENPYPRWRTCNYIFPLLHGSISEKFMRKPEILIAGCGTGQHAVFVHLHNPVAHITAIDLSKTSLAYAKMKAHEYNVQAIEFFQADILQLGSINKKFDIIESVGVLHHMQEPVEGLKVLVNLLKPGGEIVLGLYSELGRQDVVRARNIISEKGFKPDREGIQACREYIKADGSFAGLEKTQDFFSMSGCRDLIFHVQEIRYTIPMIQNLLDEAGLEFSKFILQERWRQQYLKDYPEDTAFANLDNWHDFEQRNPDAFGSMYQFRCKKIQVNY